MRYGLAGSVAEMDAMDSGLRPCAGSEKEKTSPELQVDAIDSGLKLVRIEKVPHENPVAEANAAYSGLKLVFSDDSRAVEVSCRGRRG